MPEKQNSFNARFERLFSLHKDHIYDYALKMMGDRDSAGDITQETFIRLYDQMQNEAVIDNPKNWLFIISRNLCLNKLRDRKKTQSLDSTGHIQVQDTTLSAKMVRLNKAIYALDAERREALMLKTTHGFSYAEIGAMMGLTTAAVRSLIYKARIELREIYNNLAPGGDINELRSL